MQTETEVKFQAAWELASDIGDPFSFVPMKIDTIEKVMEGYIENIEKELDHHL